MLDLSIIIVSWNAKTYLLECLRALKGEVDSSRAEIIIVDNASTDDSVEAVREEFSHVKLVANTTNLGFAKANNIGIRQSAGKYVCLINSDVKVLQGCLAAMLAYLDQHPNVGLLGPKVFNPDFTLQRSCWKFPTLGNSLGRALGLDTIFPHLTFFPHDTTGAVEVLSGCFLMARREALDQVGLLDENFFMYAEDVDWCKRFRDAGWQAAYLPTATIIHFGGGSSSQAPVKFYIEQQRANLQYWKKHHQRPALAGFFFISLFYQVMRTLRAIVLFGLKPSHRQETKMKLKRSLACAGWLLQHTELIR